MIPLGTTCTLRRPLEHPVRVVVRGRTLAQEPRYDVLEGSKWHKDVPEEWLEVWRPKTGQDDD